MSGTCHRVDMGTRERPTDIGAARGRALTREVLGELRTARLDRGLGGCDIARLAGISPAQYSRIERGVADSLSIERASVLLAAVGLELGVRAYPGGEPLRDGAHAALDRTIQGAPSSIAPAPNGGAVPRTQRPSRLGFRRRGLGLAARRGGRNAPTGPTGA